MQCASCHTTLPEGARFCLACGTPVEEQGAPAQAFQTAAQSIVRPAPDPNVRYERNVLGELVPVTDDRPQPPEGATAPGGGVELPRQRRRRSRFVATILLATSMLALATAGGIYAANVAYAPVSGGFVLIAMLLFVAYLSLDPEQQHDAVHGAYNGLATWLDRRLDPLVARADTGLAQRRERDLLSRMAVERTRRITELGDAAYRAAAAGQETRPELLERFERVRAIETQMLAQRDRIRRLAGNEESAPTQ